MDLKEEPEDEDSVDPDKLFESVWFEAETVVVTPDQPPTIPDAAIKEEKEEINPLEKKRKPFLRSRKCTQCDFKTVHGNSLKYHMLTHTDERPYPCEYCDFTSKYPPILKRHMNTQHAALVLSNAEPEMFTCKKCDYKTSIKQNLKSHVRKHKKDKQFKCNICPFETAYRHNYVKHQKSHDVGEYKCDKCTFVTKFHGHITRHMEQIHNEVIQESKHVCEFCKTTSKEKWKLRRHKERSVMENPMKCVMCDYETKYRCQMRKHKKLHLEENGDCSFVLAAALAVNDHLKGVEAEQIASSIAPKEVYNVETEKSANQYAQQIAGNANYKCDKCHFETLFHGHIIRHLQNIHNEVLESSHICEFCMSSRVDAAKLRQHKERSFVKKPLKCPACDFTTSYKCELKRHSAIQHALLSSELDVSGCDAPTTSQAEQKPTEQQMPQHGALNDDHGPLNLDCGQQNLNRGPPNMDRAPMNIDRPSMNVDRPPMNVDRPPMNIDRHPMNIDRHPMNIDRHPMNIDRHPMNIDRPPMNLERGPIIVDPSAMNAHREPMHVDRAPMNYDRGPPHIDRGPLNIDRPPMNMDHRPPINAFIRPPVNIEDGVLACDKCPFKTLYEADMAKHLVELHSICKFCSGCFGDKWSVNVHLLKSRSDTFVKCTYCDFVSYYRCETRAHMDSHFTELYSGPPKEASSNFDIRNLLTYPHDPNSVKPNTAIQKEPQHYYEIENTGPSSSRLDENREGVSQVGQSKFGQYLIDQNCVDWRSIQVIECSDSVNRYKCPLCEFPSKFKACVQRHFQRHHTGEQNRPYKCVNCNFATKTKDAIALHNKRNPPGKTFGCKHCDFTTQYKCAYANHQKRHYIQKCNICPAIYKHRHELVKHIATKHLGKGLKCFYCEYTSLRKDSMASHILLHTGERPFKCHLCSFGSVRKSLLDNHMLKQHRIFKKDVGVTYISKSKIDSLKVPPAEPPPELTPAAAEPEPKRKRKREETSSPVFMEDDPIHEDAPPPPSPYDSPDNVYGDPIDALGIHADVKPDINFVDVKPCSSPTTANITAEVLIVQNQDSDQDNTDDESSKVFACDHCDYTSPSKKKLAAHVRRTHDSNKRYKCILCPFRTSQRKNLKKHRETHKKSAVVYKCNLCTFKTKLKGFIMKHLNFIHNKTVQTKYVCVYCNISTANKFMLKAHKNRNLCPKSIQCTMCKFETIYKCQMKKHKMTHLGDVRDEKDETLTNPKAIAAMYTKERVTEQSSDEGSDSDDKCLSSKRSTYKCEKCQYKTRSEKQMSKHFVEKHNGCKYCNQNFDTKEDYAVHIQNSKSNNIVQCFFCDFDSEYQCETCKHMCSHFTGVYGIGENGGVSLETKIAEVLDSFKAKSCKTEKSDNEDCKDFEPPDGTSHLQLHKNKFGNYFIDPNYVDSRTMKIKKSDNDERFQCPACEFNTKYRGSIQRHIQRSHASNRHRPYKCIDCGFAAKSKDSIRRHNERKISRKMLHCKLCKFTAKVKCALALHSKVHYSLKCVVCSRRFSYKRGLITHFATNHLKVGLKCQFCDFVASAKEVVVEHEATHTGIKPFQCSVCEYSTCRKRYLENHFRKYHTFYKKIKPKTEDFVGISVKIEKSQEVHVCDLCGFKDVGKSRLAAHIKRKHSQQFMCERCPYTTPYKGALKSHSLTHQDFSVFKCKICPYETTAKGRILSHLRKIHNNKAQDKDAKLICEFCDEKQRSYYMLKMHIEKGKFGHATKCSMCDFESLYKCQLDKHELSHTSSDPAPQPAKVEKMYIEEMIADNALKCRFCNFIASKRSMITKHEAMHSGENPFKCNVCGHSARTKILLMVHWKKYHKH